MARIDIPDPPRLIGRVEEDLTQLNDYVQKLVQIVTTINTEQEDHETRITDLEP